MTEGREVLIVGAGPVGLALGCLLRTYGISCSIIERHQQRLQQSSAFSLHPRTVELLDILGLGSWLRSDASQVDQMTIYSEKRPILNYDFNHLNSHGDPCIFSYPQHRLERLLELRFLALGGNLRYQTELQTLKQNECSVCAELSHLGRVSQESYLYLVGCDGKNSHVRALIGTPFVGKTDDNRFLVCDGVLDRTGGAAVEDLEQGHTYLTAKGYIMLFPLPGGLHRVVVAIGGEANADTREDLETLLKHRLQQVNQAHLRFHDIHWISEASLAERIADDYFKGRVLLAGNACHIHSPICGHGINLGIQDAFNLAWKLSLVCKGHSEEVLFQSYQQERRSIAAKVLKQTDQLHRFFTSSHPVKSLIRDRMIPLLGRLKPVNKAQVMNFSGLGHDYCEGRMRWFADVKVRRGSRIGNLTLINLGKPVGLYELLGSDKFLVVGYGVEGAPPDIPQFMQRHVNFLHVCLEDGNCSPHPSSHNYSYRSSYFFSESREVLKRFHGIIGPCYLFIRPDGYIQDVVEMMPTFDALCEIRNFLIKNNILIAGCAHSTRG